MVPSLFPVLVSTLRTHCDGSGSGFAALAAVVAAVAVAGGMLLRPPGAAAGEVRGLGPGAAQTLMEQRPGELFVLDVRTPGEVAGGVIEGVDAVADWNAWSRTFAAVAGGLDKEQPILVYCRSGNRSGQAADWLAQRGYRQVINLEGGYTAWSRAGLPTSSPTAAGL